MQGSGVFPTIVVVNKRQIRSVWQVVLVSPMLLLANKDGAKPFSTQESVCDHGIEYRWRHQLQIQVYPFAHQQDVSHLRVKWCRQEHHF